jgi:hypothetical protein
MNLTFGASVNAVVIDENIVRKKCRIYICIQLLTVRPAKKAELQVKSNNKCVNY